MQTRIRLDVGDCNSNIKRLELRISNESNNLCTELEHGRALCNQLREAKQQDDSQYQELESRMEREGSSFVAAKREKERLETKVNELLSTISSAESSSQEKQNTLVGFQEIKKELESSVSMLKGEIESVKKQKSSLYKINSVVSTENSNLKAQLSEFNRRIGNS